MGSIVYICDVGEIYFGNLHLYTENIVLVDIVFETEEVGRDQVIKHMQVFYVTLLSMHGYSKDISTYACI